MFHTWIKILDKVQNSVLWLLVDNDIVKNNLKKYWFQKELIKIVYYSLIE